jgi:hypothetical protein
MMMQAEMLPNIPSVRAETESAGALKTSGPHSKRLLSRCEFQDKISKEFSREHEF